MTFISAADIIGISEVDTTADVISQDEQRRLKMGNIALTEGVYYILLSLTDGMHGYGIIQNVERLSNGRVRLAAGTLYGAINNLLEKGWIRALDNGADSRKKEYLITDAGRKVLNDEIKRLKELYENGMAVTGGVDL